MSCFPQCVFQEIPCRHLSEYASPSELGVFEVLPDLQPGSSGPSKLARPFRLSDLTRVEPEFQFLEEDCNDVDYVPKRVCSESDGQRECRSFGLRGMELITDSELPQEFLELSEICTPSDLKSVESMAVPPLPPNHTIEGYLKSCVCGTCCCRS